MKDHLSRAEIRKDAVQGTVEATATAVGEVAGILSRAVKDLAVTLGGLATEVFELRDAARRASAELALESDTAGRVEAVEAVEAAGEVEAGGTDEPRSAGG